MIQSMTGYGKATAELTEKKINVEIKSLNSKAMDLSARIAPAYREKEMEIRNEISRTLERGKVDFSLWVEKKESAESATPINQALIEGYYKQIKDIADNLNIPVPVDWFQTLLRMPDVMTKTEIQELTEEEWETVHVAIEEAIKQLCDIAVSKNKPLGGEDLNNSEFSTVAASFPGVDVWFDNDRNVHHYKDNPVVFCSTVGQSYNELLNALIHEFLHLLKGTINNLETDTGYFSIRSGLNKYGMGFGKDNIFDNNVEVSPNGPIGDDSFSNNTNNNNNSYENNSFCRYCGNKLVNSSNFCPKCGNKVNED